MIIWPGDRGLQLPVPDPVRGVVGALHRRRRRVGASARRGTGVTRVPRAQELRAGDEDPHAQRRHDAARDPHAARAQGIDNVQVNMDWQHLIMNGENLGRVRGAARRRRAARASARELGLGHLRRRQHGRRDRVHGDARARGRAAPRRLRRQRRAARLRPLPVHRGRRRRGQALRAAVALHRRRRREDRRAPRCARRSRTRTPSARTSSSTPRSVPDALIGLDVGTSGVKGVAIDADGEVLATAEEHVPALDAAARAGRSRTPRTGGARAGACSRSCRRARSASRARCTGSSCSATRRERAAAGDPLERPAHRRPSAPRSRSASASTRLIELTGNRALTGFTAPKLLWLRRHEPEVLRADPPRAAAEGLRPLPAHRRARDRRRRRVGDAALRRRAPRAGRRRSAPRSRSRSSGCRRRTSRPRSPAPATRPPPRSASASPRPGRVSVVLGTSGVVFAVLPAYAPRSRRRACTSSATRCPARGTRWA